MIIGYVIALLAGAGVFIAGMNMMSNGLQKTAGKGLKKMLEKLSNNNFAGVGIGTAVTAVIQSSAATDVMVIGFVNAGVMTLIQATSIIMGANIGTTVTGLIVSLSSFNISLYLSLLAFIGVFMAFFKNAKVKNIGSILCGLGLLFIGLESMKTAFGHEQITSAVTSLFSSINFPLLLVLVGILITALVQSSSATTGIVIVMVGSGALTLENALFIMIGANIGTCVTVLIATIGGSVNAKRSGIITLFIKLVGAVIFTTILWIFTPQITGFLNSVFHNPQIEVALFHLIFNLITTIILFPFIKKIAHFSEILVKDKEAEHKKKQLKYIDERLLRTPAIAVMQVKKEIENMADLARINIQKSLIEVKTQSQVLGTEINEREDDIDYINKAITSFLIKLTSLVDPTTEKTIGAYFHVVNDIERIGDHALNFYDLSVSMKENDLVFSENAISEIEEMYDKIDKMFDIAVTSFDKNLTAQLPDLEQIENEVDDLKEKMNAQHFIRLSEGNCKMELSAYFTSMISGLERVADHLVNIGFSVDNPTGDDENK